MKISYPEDWRTIPPEKWRRMSLTPEAYAKMRAERIEREKLAPEEGSPAPDFAAERLDATGRRTGEQFRLSLTRGRPVALAFGSYT